MGAEKQYLNGAEVKSVSSVYKFAGAKFIYTRHGNKESLHALGPLTDRIKVKVSLEIQTGIKTFERDKIRLNCSTMSTLVIIKTHPTGTN